MKYTIIPGSQDWDDHEWVHRGKDLHELHPSLWPGAREDLTVQEMEEVTYISRIGYFEWAKNPKAEDKHFKRPKVRTTSRVDDLFVEWCRIYGLIQHGRFQALDMVTPHEPSLGYL